MDWLLSGTSHHIVATYGYWAVAALIGFEAIGLPLPGESALIAAGLIAGSTHELNISLVIVAAACGTIVGGTTGFAIGRLIGIHTLLKAGRHIFLTEQRLKLGQYLFARHGGKIVFFSRFITVLRSIAAILAGLSQMSWGRFLIFNAAGGAVWATAYGVAAYAFADEVEMMSRPLAVATLLFAAIVVVAGIVLLRRQEKKLALEAERHGEVTPRATRD